MKRALPRSLKNENGAALIVALVLMIVIIAMVPVALQYTTQDMGRSTNFEHSRQAFYIAEAGLQQAKAVFNSNDPSDLLAGPDGNAAATTDNGTMPSIGTVDTSFGTSYTRVDNFGADNGSFYVRFYDNDDGDGDTTTDADGLLFVESVGNVNDTTRSVRARLWKIVLDPGDFPSAITMVGPQSQLAFSNNTFSVWGSNDPPAPYYGFDNNGNSDSSCPGSPAVATESIGPGQALASNENWSDCTLATCNDFGTNTGDQLHGMGITDPNADGGSVQYGQTTFVAQDAQDLWDTFTATGIPDVVYSGNAGQNDVQASWLGSAANPAITHVTGDLRINGNINTVGYGILIVDGDLELGGGFEWHGVVLVGACSTCTGSLEASGTATVYGAMVVGNTVDAEANITGNLDIYYSCDAIGYASDAANVITATLGWNELDTNPINP
jgi:hypothetical protein